MEFEENTMPEETSPAEPEDENLFEAEEPAEEAQPEEQPAESEAPAEPEAEPVFKIKYNGQEQELPVSQLVTLAQKGMNYDHVYGELNQLRSAREFAVLDRLAEQNGMNRQQYVQALEQQMHEARIQEQTARGIPEDVARRLMTLEQEQNQRIDRERRMQAEAARQRQFMELAREYPGIKEFPQEVIEAISQGETPLNAYRAWDLRQVKKKVEIYEKNAEAKQKTPGSAAGVEPDAPDDFLSGFNDGLL